MDVRVDPGGTDAERRAWLYAGALLVLSPSAASRELAAFGRSMAESAVRMAVDADAAAADPKSP